MSQYPEYLESIDELEFVSIIRLRGHIDQEMVPVIEDRIQSNRKKGSTIDKNVLIDYRFVDRVDSAAVAFHLVRLKEYEAKGFKVGFINVTKQLEAFLNMFKLSDAFQVFEDEDKAVKALNRAQVDVNKG